MGRKQSLADRLRRFEEVCCPIHGLFMSQIGGWYYPEDRDPYTIVGCPRPDCNAGAMANSYDGPWELMPECTYLLDETLPLSVLKAQNRQGRHSDTLKPRNRIFGRKRRDDVITAACSYLGAQLLASITWFQEFGSFAKFGT